MGEKALPYGVARGTLEVDVEGGFDAQAVIQDGFAFEAFEKKSADFFGEVTGGREVLAVGVPLNDGLRCEFDFVGRLVDVAVGDHSTEHITSSPFGATRIAGGVVGARSLH